MELNTQDIKKIIQAIAVTEKKEFNCEECYRQIEEFVEQKIEGSSPEQALPMVKHHLSICNDCREEYEVLLTALQHLSAR